MILYNITVNIDLNAEQEWVEWMNSTHIPDVLATGEFLECRFTRVLANDDGGNTYSMQYLAPDMESYIRYQNEHQPKLAKDHHDRFSGRYAAFRTLLDVMQTHGKS